MPCDFTKKKKIQEKKERKKERERAREKKARFNSCSRCIILKFYDNTVRVSVLFLVLLFLSVKLESL